MTMRESPKILLPPPPPLPPDLGHPETLGLGVLASIRAALHAARRRTGLAKPS